MKTMLLAAGAAALMVGTSDIALAQSAGGVLTVATIGEPPTLDAMQTPTDIVLTITQHMFETLYTYDSEWQPSPLLAAAMPDVSEDGLTYRIPLREGVSFHNGSTFDSADVVASLQRWMETNSKGRQVAEVVSSVEADGANAVVITLSSRYSPLLATLSQGWAPILPSETLEGASELTEFVGTGPYKLQERRPDQYTQLVRFDDYVSPDGEPDNYAGRREAVAAEVRFVPVPDANTRVEGLLAGQYDYADALPVSAFERVDGASNVEPVIFENAGWTSLNMNMSEGPLTNKALRQAIQAALNPNDLMLAAFNDERFFAVDGAFYPEGFFWHTEAGVTRYGEPDPEAVAALLEEAGYDGAPIRILTSRQYGFHYSTGEVAQAYLEALGIDVDLQVVDWATLTTRRADPAQWDIFITHSNFPGDPTTLNTITDTYPGWYTSPEKTEAVTAFLEAGGNEDRFAAWENIQSVLYDDAPLVKVGNFNALGGLANGVSGFEPAYWPRLWNVTPRG